jgi:hypothetical protein
MRRPWRVRLLPLHHEPLIITGRSMNPNRDIRKSLPDLIREKAHFNITMGEVEQIYELRKMFQCPC